MQFTFLTLELFVIIFSEFVLRKFFKKCKDAQGHEVGDLRTDPQNGDC